jgi:hypothetical protein
MSDTEILAKDPNPFDGFRAHVVESELNDSNRVYVSAQSKGKHVMSPEHLKDFCRTPEGRGAFRRYKELLGAVCQYLNAGGSSDELQQMVGALAPVLEDYHEEQPPGWFLLDIVSSADTPVCIFTNDENTMCVVYKEDDYAYVEDSLDLLHSLEGAINDRQDTETDSV